MDSFEALKELVRAYGPAGQEEDVREAVRRRVEALEFVATVDPKGNLVLGDVSRPVRVLVTAHLDEIAMIVRAIEPDGKLRVTRLGGLHPWKLGEGPVQAMGDDLTPGVLSFGSIHTEDPSATSVQAKERGLEWEQARVITDLTPEELEARGVRPGTRVVVASTSRVIWELGECVASYFLDDRADLVSWLLALESMGSLPEGVVFAATVSEEVGGEGAQYLMHKLLPDVCVALELAPNVPDAPVAISSAPSIWVNDAYAASQARDVALVTSAAHSCGIELQYQALSRGGSDASCCASRGLCARPITLGIPMENSHGFEVMHHGAMDELARLTVAVVRALGGA